MTQPSWMTCPHDGGWQYLAMNQFRCRKCNVVRFSPMTAAEMQMIPTADVAWMKGRIAQLEKALEPFGQMGRSQMHFNSHLTGDDVRVAMKWLITAAQALGLLDPETEPKGE
jgi:hypothetical protein